MTFDSHHFTGRLDHCTNDGIRTRGARRGTSLWFNMIRLQMAAYVGRVCGAKRPRCGPSAVDCKHGLMPRKFLDRSSTW